MLGSTAFHPFGLRLHSKERSIMSFGKKLLGMFVEMDESAAANAAPAETAHQEAAPTAQGVRTPSAPAAAPAKASRQASGSEGVDPKLMSQLRQTIQENNLPGFDYFEFQASLAALETVIPDEATRFRSAYATAATMGLTVPKLLETAQWYRDLLKKETEDFEKEFKTKEAAQVGGKGNEIEELRKGIQTASETIARLTKEIGDAQARMQSLEAAQLESKAKLERAHERFHTTVKTLDAEIAQNQTLIQTFLGTGA